MEVTREMAHAMAVWWGERVGGRTHHDNGDHENFASVFAGILADSMNRPTDESTVNKFVDILTEKILDEAIKREGFLFPGLLSCDYAPSKFLSDAAKEAGISIDNFPWKTSMDVCKNKNGEVVVKASDGYRAEWKQIYPEVSRV